MRHVALILLALTVPSNAEATHKRALRIAAVVALHVASALDAYSTQVALRHGGHELNPVIRPVARSPWLYPALQGLAVPLDLGLLKSYHGRPWLVLAGAVTGVHLGLAIRNSKQGTWQTEK